LTALEDVISLAAFEDVISLTAFELIVSLAALENVISLTAFELIISLAALENVVALAALENIVTLTTLKHVIARTSLKNIVVRCADNGLIFGFALVCVAPQSSWNFRRTTTWRGRGGEIRSVARCRSRRRAGNFGSLVILHVAFIGFVYVEIHSTLP
jgi:hypothetical protein